MSETSTFIGYGGRTIDREELALVPTPPATETHRPIPHHEIVRALIETLGFRQIGVVDDEYAISPDGMKMFGGLDLDSEMEGCRFSIGLRNSHDKKYAFSHYLRLPHVGVLEHGVCRRPHYQNNVAKSVLVGVTSGRTVYLDRNSAALLTQTAQPSA